MLYWTKGRRVYFDLIGPKEAPVVYFAHSLAADSGMWAEQVPALLAAGYRVLRVDMRGHGGSDQIAAAIRQGECLAIAGARHLPNVEDAGRFNRIVIDWCDRHRG